MFKTLENQEYLEPVIPNANPPNPNIMKADSSPIKLHVKDIKPIIPLNELPSLTESVNGIVKKDKDLEPKKERDTKKSDSVSF